MRYVIVSVVKGPAGNFNNNLRKEVFEKLGAKSSKLPAHFTIKAPFEADDISDLDKVLQDFAQNHKAQDYKIKGYNHFDNRVIYMDVHMNKKSKLLHDELIEELEKPGRDPRSEMPKPVLRTDVLEMKDLKEGMVLKGTVRNVIDFGAFVDIGVHQDGLVHISQMTDRYIKHPLEVVSVGDIIDVQVMSVDLNKKRIQLTMKIDHNK